MSCTNLRVKVNGVAQNDNLECASMYAGPYFSHPFSMRWLVCFNVTAATEIYTGTPAGVGPVHPGDNLKASLEGHMLLDFDIR